MPTVTSIAHSTARRQRLLARIAEVGTRVREQIAYLRDRLREGR